MHPYACWLKNSPCTTPSVSLHSSNMNEFDQLNLCLHTTTCRFGFFNKIRPLDKDMDIYKIYISVIYRIMINQGFVIQRKFCIYSQTNWLSHWYLHLNNIYRMIRLLPLCSTLSPRIKGNSNNNLVNIDDAGFQAHPYHNLYNWSMATKPISLCWTFGNLCSELHCFQPSV